jgi:hypothetical protein
MIQGASIHKSQAVLTLGDARSFLMSTVFWHSVISRPTPYYHGQTPADVGYGTRARYNHHKINASTGVGLEAAGLCTS